MKDHFRIAHISDLHVCDYKNIYHVVYKLLKKVLPALVFPIPSGGITYKILMRLFLLVLSESKNKTFLEEFKEIVAKLKNFRPEILSALFKSLNEQDVDIVILTGDLTNTSKKEEYELFFYEATKARFDLKKLFVVPGNHDLIYMENKDNFYDYFPESKGVQHKSTPYCEIFGLNSVDEREKIEHFLISNINGAFKLEDIGKVAYHLQFLEPEKPVIFASHHPPVGSGEISVKNNQLENIFLKRSPENYQYLLDLVELYNKNPTFFLSGHIHEILPLIDFGNKKYLIAGSTVFERSYYLLDIYPDFSWNLNTVKF